MTSVTVIIASAALLIFFGALFAYEDRRQKRVGARTRNALDRLFDYIARTAGALYQRFLNGAVRLAVLYIIHSLLGGARRLLSSGAAFITSLQRRNKQMARSITKQRSHSHLSAVVEDRKNNALSETDKETLKSRSLEGK